MPDKVKSCRHLPFAFVECWRFAFYFSLFKVFKWVAPGNLWFWLKREFPFRKHHTNRATKDDLFVGFVVGFIILYPIVVAVGFFAILAKFAQLSFVIEQPLEEWNVFSWFRLCGFILQVGNLSSTAQARRETVLAAVFSERKTRREKLAGSYTKEGRWYQHEFLARVHWEVFRNARRAHVGNAGATASAGFVIASILKGFACIMSLTEHHLRVLVTTQESQQSPTQQPAQHRRSGGSGGSTGSSGGGSSSSGGDSSSDGSGDSSGSHCGGCGGGDGGGGGGFPTHEVELCVVPAGRP